jgi:hypothetical protein
MYIVTHKSCLMFGIKKTAMMPVCISDFCWILLRSLNVIIQLTDDTGEVNEALSHAT